MLIIFSSHNVNMVVSFDSKELKLQSFDSMNLKVQSFDLYD